MMGMLWSIPYQQAGLATIALLLPSLSTDVKEALCRYRTGDVLILAMFKQ